MAGLRKHALYETSVWPRWYSQIDRRAPIVLLPGIMGSELYDDERDGAGNGTVWVDGGIFHEVDNLEVAQLSPDGLVDSQRQSIYARSTVNPRSPWRTRTRHDATSPRDPWRKTTTPSARPRTSSDRCARHSARRSRTTLRSRGRRGWSRLPS